MGREVADKLIMRQCTIFTLADWDYGKAQYRIASQRFQLVAASVFTDGKLEKKNVLTSVAKVKPGSKVHRHMESKS